MLVKPCVDVGSPSKIACWNVRPPVRAHGAEKLLLSKRFEKIPSRSIAEKVLIRTHHHIVNGSIGIPLEQTRVESEDDGERSAEGGNIVQRGVDVLGFNHHQDALLPGDPRQKRRVQQVMP